MSVRSRRLRKAVLVLPTFVLLLFVLADVLPELAMIVAPLLLLGVAALALGRCLAVAVELRWDEVVLRNPIRTYRVPWREVERVVLDGEGRVAFVRRGFRLAAGAQATQLRLRREFVRELRRFAAAHEHVAVDARLERRLS